MAETWVEILAVPITAALGTDHTWSGLTATLTAGANLTIGQCCYVGADGKMELADADAAATMPIVAMATGSISENATGIFLLHGFFRDDSAWEWATLGGLLYGDTTTAGAMNQTAPSGAADIVQVVGVAMTADIVYFCPDKTTVEIVA